jgi:hypothetical protein
VILVPCGAYKAYIAYAGCVRRFWVVQHFMPR